MPSEQQPVPEVKHHAANILNLLAENRLKSLSVDSPHITDDSRTPDPSDPAGNIGGAPVTPPPNPSPVPTPSPTSTQYSTHESSRLLPFINGFIRAIATLQGAVPAVWSDREHAAQVLAQSIPRLTTARLIVYCRDTRQDLEIVAARVLTDMFATEPGLLELTPEEAAVEGAALVQQMWPQAAFQPRKVEEPEPEVQHPILTKLEKLASQWHRLSLMPVEQAKTQNPTLWRSKVLNDIALTKAQALQAGLKQKAIMKALESAGDRWVWEIPPPATGFFNDEYMQPPEGTDIVLANMPS